MIGNQLICRQWVQEGSWAKVTIYVEWMSRLEMVGSVPPLSHMRLWSEWGQLEMYQLMTRTEFLRKWSLNSPWFWNPEGQYYVHRTLSVECMVKQLNAVYSLMPFFMIPSNTILLSTLTSCKWSVPFRVID